MHATTRLFRRLGLAVALAVVGLAAQSARVTTTFASPSLHVCAGPAPCFHTIQLAIDAATGNTIIYIDPKTYTENLSVPGLGTATTLTLWATLSATVDGSSHPGTSVLTVASGHTVALMNVGLTKGNAAQGGGIDNVGGTVTLLGTSSVYKNTAHLSGGGIDNDGGIVSLHNSSSVHDNTITGGELFLAGSGAGIDNLGGGTVLLEDTSSVYHNTAPLGSFIIPAAVHTDRPPLPISSGGGISNEDGMVTLEDSSTVHDNSAFEGGGIENAFNLEALGASTLTVRDKASVYHNTALLGGGIANFVGFEITGNGGTTVGLTILGAATVHDNVATSLPGATGVGLGGGILNTGDVLMKNTSSVYTNHADEGGGIYTTPVLPAIICPGGSITTALPPITCCPVTFAVTTDINCCVASSALVRTDACANVNLTGLGNSVVLQDFSSVHDNVADTDGGGIYNQSLSIVSPPNPTLKSAFTPPPPLGVTLAGSSSVYHNSAHQDGGGVYNEDAFFAMHDDSTIHDNTALNDGGGVYSETSPPLPPLPTSMSDRSSVYHNTALAGGGVYDYDTGMTMSGHSSVHDNSATGKGAAPASCCGGGIANIGGGAIASALMLNDFAEIYHNTAFDGAGVYNSGNSTVTLNLLSSIDHNIASDHGGGVFRGGTSTVAGNTAHVIANIPDNIYP
jgi:hypothetical protein